MFRWLLHRPSGDGAVETVRILLSKPRAGQPSRFIMCKRLRVQRR